MKKSVLDSDHLVSTLSQGRMQEKSSLKCGYFIECVAQFKPYRLSMDLYQFVHRVVVIFLLLVFEEMISLKKKENTQMYSYCVVVEFTHMMTNDERW